MDVLDCSQELFCCLLENAVHTTDKILYSDLKVLIIKPTRCTNFSNLFLE